MAGHDDVSEHFVSFAGEMENGIDHLAGERGISQVSDRWFLVEPMV